MKKIILIALVVFFGCKKEDEIETKPCSNISDYKDTVQVGKYKLWLITSISKNSGDGALEIVDTNYNTINGSADFKFNLVQLKNGNNCWETNEFSNKLGSSMDVFSGMFYGVPTWAADTNTKAIVNLTILGNQYNLVDQKVNKSK